MAPPNAWTMRARSRASWSATTFSSSSSSAMAQARELEVTARSQRDGAGKLQQLPQGDPSLSVARANPLERIATTLKLWARHIGEGDEQEGAEAWRDGSTRAEF